VLLANAWHHRTDALTSVVALVAIAGGQIYPFLDPVGGCLVSALIVRVGYQSGRSACQEIVDRGLDTAVLTDVKAGAEKGLQQGLKELIPSDILATECSADGGVVVGSVKGTKSGAYYIVDVEIEAPGNMTVNTFEALKDSVKEGVKHDVKNVKIVRVFIKTRVHGINGKDKHS